MNYKKKTPNRAHFSEFSNLEVPKEISVLHKMDIFLGLFFFHQGSCSVTCCHDHMSLLALFKTDNL